MSKTIKSFLILTFITATCWAYLLGEYMGTWTQGGGSYNVSSGTWSGGGGTSVSVGGSSGSGSSRSSRSGSSSGSRSSGSGSSGGAVDVSSLNLGFFSGGSSGNITAQSNSGTSGGTVDRTKSIDVSAYARMCDGNIDKMIAAIKSDYSRTPTAGEYQAAAQKISSGNKISILSVAAENALIAEYNEKFKALMTDNFTIEQIAKISNNIVVGIAEKFNVSIDTAEAILVETNSIQIEKGISGSLYKRLNELSMNDPMLIEAKDIVSLRQAIAENVPETSGSEEVMRPIPVMGPFERGDFAANESRAGTYQVRDSNGNLRFLTPAEKREVAIIVYERSKQEGDPLSVGVACPTLGGPFASVIQEVTGESPMDPFGRAAYEADISRFSNYYQVSENQAKQAINLLLGDSIVGSEWVQRDPETGEVKVDYLEVGPETGVGYPVCPFMRNDVEDYLNYVIGVGPRPEAPTSEDIEKIVLGSRTTEINIQNKAEEFKNEIGTNISEEMMIMALGLAIVDKGLIVTDENVREVINSITLNEVEYYIAMINKVAEEYNLTPSEAASVLKVHISNQRINNPNYKLSEENDIIKSIEANKSSTGLYIEIIQDAKTGSVSPVAIDLNCDGNINLADFGILLSFWGKDPSKANSCQSPDINQDGKVNLADFSIMMSYWNYAFK